MACGSNTDDDTLTPALMAGLEGGAHDTNVTGAVEGVIAATVGHFDELLLDTLAAELGGVDEVGGAELAAPRLLTVVDIDDDDATGLVLDGALDDGEPDAASAKDGDVGAFLNAGSFDGCAVARGDTAAEQASPVGGRLVRDRGDGDVG